MNRSAKNIVLILTLLFMIAVPSSPSFSALFTVLHDIDSGVPDHIDYLQKWGFHKTTFRVIRSSSTSTLYKEVRLEGHSISTSHNGNSLPAAFLISRTDPAHIYLYKLNLRC